MKKIYLLLLLAAFAIPSFSQTVTRILGSSPFQDSAWVFDSSNINVVRRFSPTPSSGGSLTGMTGITKAPNGTIFCIVKQSAVSGRMLGKLDPYSGLVTLVGNLGDNFSSLTFTTDGKLYGVTGNGASVPETLYQIDTATAAKRLVKTLGNGVDGEIICYNPDDNMIYHWSGNGTIVYEKFDTVSGPYNFTNIPIIGTTNGETFGMLYRGNGVFIGSNISSRFQLWNTSGNVYPQYGSTAPDDIRGTVFITRSRAITGNNSFCIGDSTLLTAAAGAASYQWYRNGSLISGATSSTYYATQAGHYNVIFSDACGTDSSGVGMDVGANPLPTVSLSASGPTTFCAGGSVNLNGTSGGTSQWYMNGAAITGETNTTYIASTSGVYNMIKTNVNGCSDSANTGITVTVNPLPVVTISGNTTFCAGDSVQLTASAGSSFLWYINGVATSVMNQSIYANAAANYNVVVTDANSCSDSASAGTMTTMNPVPVITLTSDTSSCNMPITLDAGFTPGATYLWCSGATTQTYVAMFSQITCVTVTDTNGCSSNAGSTVAINPIPSVSVSAMLDSVCINTPPVVLTGTPTGGTFSGPGVTPNTFTPSNAGAGVSAVMYMYTDSNGCSNSDTTMISVFNLPTVTLSSSDNTMCTTDANATLTGTPAGGTFSGTGVSGNQFSPAVAGTGTFTVTYSYSDPNGCSNTATTSITVSPCTGIAEYSGASFGLYPNPANENVTITLASHASVSFCNALGEVVLTTELNAGTNTIDLSGFADGIYFVKVANEQGQSTQRLILNR